MCAVTLIVRIFAFVVWIRKNRCSVASPERKAEKTSTPELGLNEKIGIQAVTQIAVIEIPKLHGSTNVGKAIEDRSAALIANHGAVCIAKTLEKAFHLAIVLERTCKIYMISKQVGTPKRLPDEVVEDEQDLWVMMSGY